MAGYKIHHKTVKGGVVTATDFTRPYGEPIKCVSCNTIHHAKTYHLSLDENGDAVVSESIMNNLTRMKVIGTTKKAQFVVDTTVDHPKPINLGMGRGGGLTTFGKPTFSRRPVMHLDFGEKPPRPIPPER